MENQAQQAETPRTVLGRWIDNQPQPEIEITVEAYALDLFRRVHGVRAVPELMPHAWQECLDDAAAFLADPYEEGR